MKALNPLLIGVFILSSLVSCTKQRTICRGCDEEQDQAAANAIQGTLVGANAYSGSSTCETGTYNVRHDDQFNYQFWFRIGNGRLEDFKFDHSFTFSVPALSSGTLVYKNMAYNDSKKKISILISYQTTITDYVVVGFDANNTPIYETRKTSKTFDFVDVINTCDNSFVLGN